MKATICFLLFLLLTALQTHARRNQRLSLETKRKNSANNRKTTGGENKSPLRNELNEQREEVQSEQNRNAATERDSTSAIILDSRQQMQLAMQQMFGSNQTTSSETTQTEKTDANPRSDANLNTSRGLGQNYLNEMNRFSSTNKESIAPDFMLDLQQVYNRDKKFMLSQSKIQGDTIRSFFPISDHHVEEDKNRSNSMIIIPYNKKENLSTVATEKRLLQVFAFNLSSIASSESIVGSALKTHGLRSMALHQTSWKIFAALYESKASIEPEKQKIYRRLGPVLNLRTTNGQTWTDRNMVRMTSKARHKRRILVVRLEMNENTKQKLNHEKLEKLPRRFVPAAHDKHVTKSSTFPLTPIITIYCNDTAIKRTIENFQLQVIKNMNNIPQRESRKNAYRLRQIRSSLLSSDKTKNELPGEDAELTATLSYSPTSRNDQTELHDNGIADRNLIQTLEDRRTKSRRRKLRKRRSRKCRRRRRKDGKKRRCNEQRKPHPRPKTELNKKTTACSRQALLVDFEEIGWSDWIISPKRFNAYYCSGVCEFTSIKGANPSNHAIIQSFINEFDINPEVPKPCCVPESLTSLSVLYFDQDDSVVLKVYPNMSVDKCSCQ